jgi:hypothetical protein
MVTRLGVRSCIGSVLVLLCVLPTTSAVASSVWVNTGPLAAGFTIEIRQRTKGGTVVNQTLTAANLATRAGTTTFVGSGTSFSGIKLSNVVLGWIQVFDAGDFGEPEAVKIPPPVPAPAAPPVAPPPPPPGGTKSPSSGAGLGAGGGAEIDPGINERSFFRLVFDELPMNLATTSGLISLGYNDGFVASYQVNIDDSVDTILDALETSLVANGVNLDRTPTGIDLLDPIGIGHAGIGSYEAIGLSVSFVVGTFDVDWPGTLMLLTCALPLIGVAKRRAHEEAP